MTNAFKPALTYPYSTLSQLSLEASRQMALLAEIKTVLPEDMGRHALYCVIGLKSITVYTDSPNWATRLRFYGETMLNAAKGFSAAGQLSSLRIKVLPALDTPSQKRIPSIPSLTTTKALLSHSQTIHDPKLRAALEKLSSTLARLNTENA